MGQRSHIFVRVKGDRTKNIANYYHWNYGERMVSRAAWGLQWVKEHSKSYYSNSNADMLLDRVRELENIWDVNFDMGDIQMHTNLFKEYEECEIPVECFRDIGFEGDGGLCVLVDGNTIKYAFVHAAQEPKTAEEYMLSDIGEYREVPPAEYVSDYIKRNHIKTSYERNLKALSGFCLMTQDEFDEFMDERI